MVKSSDIQKHIMGFLSDGRERSVQEIKNYLSEARIGEYSEGQFAGSLNTLQRNGSIRKISRGKYAIRNGKEELSIMRTCFVVSPIGDAGSEVRDKADKLFKHIIKPICDNCDIEAIRVDQLNDANSITQTIIEKLETADLVIADISGHNPNVFYEIGFRTRTNKPIIYLKTKGEKLPFDITTIRTFDYDLTDLDDVEEVKNRLEQTIQSLSFPLSEPDEDSAVPKHENMANVLPILYQIIDALADLQNEVKTNNNDIIQTVIKAMQNTQPQMSAEAALQTQLLGAFMQNPDSLMKLAEVAEKFPSKDDKNKLQKP